MKETWRRFGPHDRVSLADIRQGGAPGVVTAHGQGILDDLTRQTQPGYPAIRRLKGLAELRGVATALCHE